MKTEAEIITEIERIKDNIRDQDVDYKKAIADGDELGVESIRKQTKLWKESLRALEWVLGGRV